MKKIILCFKIIFFNIISFIINIFYRRDNKIWIFGSWMGEKFADNTRYLFQFLHLNLSSYGLNKVYWATRNLSLYKELKSIGYNVLLIGTKESFWIHLKAGVHVICNSNGRDYLPDIDTFLSFGAKKIQLWHGVGIKACAFLKTNGKSKIRNFLSKHLFMRLESPGNWYHCFHLATSLENKRVAIEDFGIKKKNIIIAAYPRDCDCPQLLNNELILLNKIIQISRTKKIILYLPTFKQNLSHFIDPNCIPGFDIFLKENNIFWIQKNHSADKNLYFNNKSENVLNLPANFDINILYKYITILISDYSSATTDAIAFDKMTIDYCPDYNFYKNEDRGFVSDYDKYHIGNFVNEPEALFSCIKNNLNINPKSIKKHNEVKSFLLGNELWDLAKITKAILKKIY